VVPLAGSTARPVTALAYWTRDHCTCQTLGHHGALLLAIRPAAAPVIRTKTGGRLDFWTLENNIAGRARRYHRIVIDEAAFTKDGDNKTDGSMMEIWEKSIKPTLYDYGGEVLVSSNSAGKNPDNFFYNICTDSQYGFEEFHATTMDNPVLPKRLQNETAEAWMERRAKYLDDLKTGNDPLVYAQEYLAEFVDWAGVGFFAREKLLDNGQPVPYPVRCDGVFAVIDTASKTGTEHDATAVTLFARNNANGTRRIVDSRRAARSNLARPSQTTGISSG
jgi:hypothetical protein